MRNERIHARLLEFTEALTKTYAAGPVPGHNIAPRCALPSRSVVISILRRLFEVFFPGFFGKQYLTRENINYYIGALLDEISEDLGNQIYSAVRHQDPSNTDDKVKYRSYSEDCLVRLFEQLPEIRHKLMLDTQAGFDGDPAAKTYNEVIFSYPGLVAICTYRVAHELEILGVPLLPRIMSEYAHSKTGIDIHPGATIGERFFIDHGTGIVIGETSIIGNNVKLYQGVTLGALSFPKDERGKLIRGLRRHPQICDSVVIYSGATILGNITIGEKSVIGGNVWLTQSVPPNTKVLNTPQLPQFRPQGDSKKGTDSKPDSSPETPA
ncbi:MAG: serine acetyltransferase [Candidatus Eisenbacteria bacterium]|uniref:serine O-acetyltransferase n=1 Tax=Eiseniibacteriota bacterium TaxID=2212470 RepID=A0A948S067_UNCEI|nr:serine acetyltransferase [Candidatus Eisenbacteria bacterium]MBU1950178.1 serine acetyltransferase [Candidatus Eisenbacteria bacterium]MBU2692804.1 serine acetyltransferase [Candidatus Eisenbacteria bacterium]